MTTTTPLNETECATVSVVGSINYQGSHRDYTIEKNTTTALTTSISQSLNAQHHCEVHRPADKLVIAFPTRVLLSRLPFTALPRLFFTLESPNYSQWFKLNLQLLLAMVPNQIRLVPLWTMSSPGRFSLS